ncbi:hypothetical protein [Acidipila rosea]|uniref:Uncharacterized protein n=1 Tax=Acidipila rosea TaxID=768535 RepID=A0A4R1LAX2_9BACT|nr:hypothetical protein [Acidipila rosea]MBW4043763.1 hypothetical protein [Acidobacteriota bacterium]TCK74063.1 hypothetical protein C7378_1683 [Acidipila rosea]
MPFEPTTVSIAMTLDGAGIRNGATRSQTLPVNTRVVGFRATRLTRIFYVDGTEWQPSTRESCEFLGNSGTRRLTAQ